MGKASVSVVYWKKKTNCSGVFKFLIKILAPLITRHQFSLVALLCRLLATLWTAARQASLSIINSWSSHKLKSIRLVMSSSAIPISSRLQSFPASGSFQKNTQDWSPLGWTGWISLQSKGVGVHWKDWCWSWNSNTLATWCEELTHWKRPWCWERLRSGGEGDDRGWDGWMASPTRWTWVWLHSRSWWWTGRPGVLWFMESQRVRHDWATELNWTDRPPHGHSSTMQPPLQSCGAAAAPHCGLEKLKFLAQAVAGIWNLREQKSLKSE